MDDNPLPEVHADAALQANVAIDDYFEAEIESGSESGDPPDEAVRLVGTDRARRAAAREAARLAHVPVVSQTESPSITVDTLALALSRSSLLNSHGGDGGLASLSKSDKTKVGLQN